VSNPVFVSRKDGGIPSNTGWRNWNHLPGIVLASTLKEGQLFMLIAGDGEPQGPYRVVKECNLNANLGPIFPELEVSWENEQPGIFLGAKREHKVHWSWDVIPCPERPEIVTETVDT
jgi:hypothetical protein